nr:nucleotide-binding alpha-beta plait domain-containing protein [Tanacetum cinerariifolium]
EPTGISNTYVQVVKGDVKTGGKETESIPVVFLDDECLMSNDFSMSLLGRVKEFASLANLKVALCNEGFVNIKIKYMGELWVLLEFVTGESIKLFRDNVSAGSWWGKLLDVDDQEETCYHSKRLCIHTKSGRNILESFKIIHRGTAHWIRACETPGWVPDFADESDDEDQEDNMSNDGGAKEHIPGGEGDGNEQEDDLVSGGSILGILDEVVKVGQVMGYNMEGSKSNMADIIGSQGVEEVYR